MWIHITYNATFILQTKAEFIHMHWKTGQLPQPFAVGGNSEVSIVSGKKTHLVSPLQKLRDQIQYNRENCRIYCQ
jgi:hypothetical protein